MEKQAKQLCNEFAIYLRAEIRKPEDWKEEYGNFPPTNTTLRNYFIDILKTGKDKRKIKLLVEHYDLESFKDSKKIDETLFQKSKSIENFFLRYSTPFYLTLDFIALFFNTKYKSVFEFAKLTKGMDVNADFFKVKVPTVEKEVVGATKKSYVAENFVMPEMQIEESRKTEIYAVYFTTEDRKTERAKLYITDEWSNAELFLFGKNKEPYAGYKGKIAVNDCYASFNLELKDRAPFLISLKLNSSLRNNVLVGTYSTVSLLEDLPVAGSLFLKKLSNEREFNREPEIEAVAEVYNQRIKVLETAFLTTNRLPFKKIQSVYNDFTGVYEVYEINQKDEKFNKYILELSSEFKARLKHLDSIIFTGYFELLNHGEIICVHLSTQNCTFTININAYYNEHKTLYATFTGVDRKNRIVGGKMFLAKFEDDKFDNLNIEKLNIDDREFKKLASYYSKLVPFFLGKISGFNEYPIMYQLGYLKLGEN